MVNHTSLEVQRLDSISKSSVYAYFSETISGLSTLRAYNKHEAARSDHMEKIDANQRAYFAYIASNRWLSLHLEFMGALLIFAAALFSVIAPGSSDPAVLAFAMTFALQVTSILGSSVRIVTGLEARMNSVDRLEHYGKKLEQEAPRVVRCSNSPEGEQNWTSSVAVTIRDVKVRYRPELDLVLKGVSADVTDRQRKKYTYGCASAPGRIGKR